MHLQILLWLFVHATENPSQNVWNAGKKIALKLLSLLENT